MPITNGPATSGTTPTPSTGCSSSFHHSAAGVAWRWRTELTLLAALAAALWRLAT